MINDLQSIDWAAMAHAYGQADDVPQWLHDMTSPDAELWEQAFSSFYSAAHHQGDVYPCTLASLPFLFAMADDPCTPDRASMVALIVSIGREAVEREDRGSICIGPDGEKSTAYEDTAALMRGRGQTFAPGTRTPAGTYKPLGQVRQPAPLARVAGSGTPADRSPARPSHSRPTPCSTARPTGRARGRRRPGQDRTPPYRPPRQGRILCPSRRRRQLHGKTQQGRLQLGRAGCGRPPH
ncbi:hypothetical protein [Streptomyces sp. NPDC059979]|uniref:hypothetical protein n=1 Tax=Streptomyces sp. NPDC059979 TaxID=3347021 RepID=UPI003694B5B4